MAKSFYVYRILGEMGETVYIGKGTGRRLQTQKRRFMSDGEVIETYSTERQAYFAEKKLIAKHNPPLNRCGGGGGGIYGKPNQPKGTEESLFEIAARALNCMRFPQRHFTWFDMIPALKNFVGALIERFGEEEFAKRIRPYGIEMKFENSSQVTAA